MRYLCDRLAEEVTLDAIDESLEAEILEKSPENISEMRVGEKILLSTLPHIIIFFLSCTISLP